MDILYNNEFVEDLRAEAEKKGVSLAAHITAKLTLGKDPLILTKIKQLTAGNFTREERDSLKRMFGLMTTLKSVSEEHREIFKELYDWTENVFPH